MAADIQSTVETSSDAEESKNKDSVVGDMLEPSPANTPLVRGAAIALGVAAMAGTTKFLPSQGLAFVHLMGFATWMGATVWTTFIAGITMFKNLPRQTFGRLQVTLLPMICFDRLHRAVVVSMDGVCCYTGMVGLASLETGRLEVVEHDMRHIRGVFGTGLGVATGPQSKLFPMYFTLGASALAVQLVSLNFATPGGIPQKAALTLGIALAMCLLNMLVVEPMSTKLMFERYDLENVEGERDEEKIEALRKEFGKLHGISSLANLVGMVAGFAHAWWLAGFLTLA